MDPNKLKALGAGKAAKGEGLPGLPGEGGQMPGLGGMPLGPDGLPIGMPKDGKK